MYECKFDSNVVDPRDIDAVEFESLQCWSKFVGAVVVGWDEFLC